MIRLSLLSAAAMTAALVACTETPTTTTTTPVTAVPGGPSFLLGNGFPEGGHDYSLQIIGVPQDKTATMDNNNGRRIFVQLYSDNVVTDPGGKNNNGLKKGGGDDQNHIYLCNSTNGENDVVDPRCDAWRADGHVGDFGVIDANGTDGDGAIFGLPDPCADDNSLTACTPTYQIWARAKAGGGNVILTTCADETGTGFDGEDDVWCGDNQITLSKATHHKAVDVSNILLFMHINVTAADDQLQNCINGTTGVDYGANSYNVYLFDRCFENYFWNYDNNGLKVLELRFYFVA